MRGNVHSQHSNGMRLILPAPELRHNVPTYEFVGDSLANSALPDCAIVSEKPGKEIKSVSHGYSFAKVRRSYHPDSFEI